MRRTVDPEVPVHLEYALTEAGRTLSEPLRALEEWAIAHLGECHIAGSLRPRGLTSSRRKTMISGSLHCAEPVRRDLSRTDVGHTP